MVGYLPPGGSVGDSRHGVPCAEYRTAVGPLPNRLPNFICEQNPLIMTATKKFSLLLVIFQVVAAIGCGTTSWKKPDVSSLLPPGPPTQVVAVWEPAVKHSGENKPERGFGGRVFFYDQSMKKPIKVKGNVVVYAFDEEGRRADDTQPSRSYVFEEKDVKKLYSKSKLGPSYSFWVPWDAEGPDGNVKKVSLIVRYVPKVGSSVVSSQALVYLPGKAGQSELLAKAEWDTRSSHENSIQEVAAMTKKESTLREATIESNNRSGTMQTTTIGLPVSVAQNLRKLPPQMPAEPQSPILLAGFALPTEDAKESEQEPKPLLKPDSCGHGPHALEEHKPVERPAMQVADQEMITLK